MLILFSSPLSKITTWRGWGGKAENVKLIIWKSICLSLVLVLLAFLAIAGYDGTDTREQVDDTVKELSGKKKLDQMDQMKKDINKASQQQAERFKKTEESAEEK